MSFDLKLSGGDIVVQPSGSPALVFNQEKLLQDLLKIILTPLGSNKLYAWYGSPINSTVLGKPLDRNLIKTEIANSITYAINNLIRLQQNQEKTGQYLTPAEAISQLLDVKIEPSVYDARQYNIYISVRTRRGNVVEESLILAV